MKFKRTNKVFYILSITLFVTTIVLIVFLIRTKRENLPYNEEYKVEIESPQFYNNDASQYIRSGIPSYVYFPVSGNTYKITKIQLPYKTTIK